MVSRSGEFVAIAGSCGDPVEIAQPFGLQTIGDHAVEQMARQMVRRLAAEPPELTVVLVTFWVDVFPRLRPALPGPHRSYGLMRQT
jgi:hypothetical protein